MLVALAGAPEADDDWQLDITVGGGAVVSLTKRGIDLQEQIFNAFLAGTQDLLEPLTANELQQTDRTLQKLLDVFEERPPR